MTKNHNARFMEEQTPDKVVAHSPECRQFLDREMPLERDLGDRHAFGKPVYQQEA
jgi:hypothetical protein